MPRIFDVPIEPFESRYSLQWRRWFSNFYERNEIKWQPISGATITQEIETGSFLDIHGTNVYKASQLTNLIVQLKTGAIKDGDWVFFHDLWFPGIEMLAYIRDASGVKFKIAGCLHAGGWDPNDFVSLKMRAMWTLPFEEMLFGIADKIFLATHYHKTLINDYFMKKHSHLRWFEEETTTKIEVTGFPIFPEVSDYPNKDAIIRKVSKGKRPIVVFPHRLDREKSPGAFDELAKRPELAGFDFIKTKEVCRNKKEYYKLLRIADYAVSFAYQETWGIAMQEAAFGGAITFVPERLSYREMYAPALQYKDMDQLVFKLVSCEGNLKETYRKVQDDTNMKLKVSGEAAIPIMMRHMGMM